MRKFKLLLEDKKLLIFDFDGTIADTSPFHEQAFNETLKNFNVSFLYKNIAGFSSQDAFKKIFTKNKVIVSEDELLKLVQQKQKIARRLISAYLEPSEGLLQFLLWAKSRFKLCIVSSGSTKSIENALNKLNFFHFFDEIICSEDVNFSKPNPEGFIKALDIFSVSSDDALIFEDSSSGFMAAEAAGINYLDVNSFSWIDLYNKSK